MGLELATMAGRRSAQDQAMRYLKRYAPDYLYMRIDSAPGRILEAGVSRSPIARISSASPAKTIWIRSWWRPWRGRNPSSIPRPFPVSSARGLTQIMPPTGRELSRQLAHPKPYSTARLFQPQVNLQLGIILFEIGSR